MRGWVNQSRLVVPATIMEAVEQLQMFLEEEAGIHIEHAEEMGPMTPEFIKTHFEICKTRIREIENGNR